MDIGKILRERVNFRTYVNPPRKPGKKWGVFPSVKVDQLIFIEDEEFKCPVSLFSYDKKEIEEMQTATILQASLGMKKNGWNFFCHAANHGIQKVHGLYRSDIYFRFKVVFPNVTKEEAK